MKRTGRKLPGETAPASAGGRHRWRVLRLAALVAILALGVVSRYRFFGWCLHDDAFISFRYARNLVRGHGLVMNPGERVEGFTNFLWTVAAAPVLALGFDPAIVSQVVGAAVAVGLMLASYFFTIRRLGGGWYALVTPLFLAGNLAFVMESLSGLETLVFSACLYAACVSFLEERRGNGRPAAWAAWCGIGSLLRPEGLLVFGILAMWSLLGIARGESSAQLRRAVGIYVLLVAPLVAWRLLYYGDWVPNTFHTKVGFTAAQFWRGWRFTRSLALALTGPLLLSSGALSVVALVRPLRAPGVPLASARGRLFSGRPRDEAIAVLLLVATVYIAYVWLVGGDYEPTGRFHAPVLVLLYLLFQEGLRTFVLFVRAYRPRFTAAAVAVAVLAGGACLWRSEDRILRILNQRGWPQSRLQHHQQLVAVGEWLRANTRPDALVALSSIGAIPYYADRPVLDMMGLTDAHIGRRRMPDMGQGPAGHEKGDGAYVLQRRPDIVLFDKGHLFPEAVAAEKVLSEARGVSENELSRSSEFAREYELRRAQASFGVLHFFARRVP